MGIESQQGVNNLEISWALIPEFNCRQLMPYELWQSYNIISIQEYFAGQAEPA